MSPTRTRRPQGQVALVGAGTGDPGLLTRRAGEVIEHADLVVADATVSEFWWISRIIVERLERISS